MNKVKAKSGINGMKTPTKFEIKNTVFITNMSFYLIKVPKLDFKLVRLCSGKTNFNGDFPRQNQGFSVSKNVRFVKRKSSK